MPAKASHLRSEVQHVLASHAATEQWAGRLEKLHEGMLRLGSLETPLLVALARKLEQDSAPSPHEPIQETGEPAPVMQFWGIFFNVVMVLLFAYFYHSYRRVPHGKYEEISTTAAAGAKVDYNGLDCTVKRLFYTGDAVLAVPGSVDTQANYGEYAAKTKEDEQIICNAARLWHVQGDWKHHCLSCFQEPGTSCVACCCLPLRWAETISFVKILNFWSALSLMLFLFAFRQFTPSAALFHALFVIVGVNYRQELRRRFEFQSVGGLSYATDCCLYIFCPCCAVVQEARHVEDALALDHDETACPEDRRRSDLRRHCWTSNIFCSAGKQHRRHVRSDGRATIVRESKDGSRKQGVSAKNDEMIWVLQEDGGMALIRCDAGEGWIKTEHLQCCTGEYAWGNCVRMESAPTEGIEVAKGKSLLIKSHSKRRSSAESEVFSGRSSEI